MDAKNPSHSSQSIDVDQSYEIVARLLGNIESVVLGKRDVAKMCLVALLSGEHVLLEDVPGVGKTLMGKSIARSVNGTFRRIQFTPDLLPSDIVGSNVFNSRDNQFEFNPGPVFSNFVLADEINRAPPRTQSALLEAMSDAQVSIDGKTHELEQPFTVIATQNPFEFEGTYVLPESQMDRFLIRISMGYPDREFERDILNSHRGRPPVEELKATCSTEDLIQLQSHVCDVKVEDSISDYMLNVIHATRESPQLSVGVSTRGALLWYRATQAMAFMDGRNYAVPDDAKELAVAVLSHRVQLPGIVQGGHRDESEAVIREIVSTVATPR